MDERPVRQYLRKLDSQSPHVNIDGAVAQAQRLAPDSLVDLFTADDPAIVASQLNEQPKLTNREMECNAGSGDKALIWPQLEWTEAKDALEIPRFDGFYIYRTQSHARDLDGRPPSTHYREVKSL